MSTPTVDPADVPIVRWPDQEPVRRRLADLRLPRLLLVPLYADPPEVVDQLEDWLREPADPVDLVARARTLRRRAARTEPPAVLDSDGLLRLGDRWVAIPDAQLPLVRLLLARFDRLVRTEELTQAYVATGGSGHASSIKTVVARLASRFADVGLALTTVRGRGVVLSHRPST
jgi:two-component system, OmpR family, response regulator